MHSTQPKKQARDVFQTILKGRRSWKTLRDGDLVWPPDLEAALLEGLESYVPDDSRETRLLGRFPRRNRFISDYIFQATGKTRTPKQVGSRLQQLRDTTGGKHLLKLLCPSRRDLDQYRDTCGSPTSPFASDYSGPSDGSTPSTPTTPNFHSRHTPHTVVTIEVLPKSSPVPYFYESSPQHGSSCYCVSYSPVVSESACPQNGSVSFFRPSSQPRHLRCIDPTITFVRRADLPPMRYCYSFFTVVSNGTTIHTDTAPVEVSPVVADSLPEEEASEVYSTRLVPRFWDEMCEIDDPSKLSIYHEVVYSASDTSQPQTVFKATYKFVYSPLGSPSIVGSSCSRSSTEPASPMTPPLSSIMSHSAPYPTIAGYSATEVLTDCTSGNGNATSGYYGAKYSFSPAVFSDGLIACNGDLNTPFELTSIDELDLEVDVDDLEGSYSPVMLSNQTISSSFEYPLGTTESYFVRDYGY